MTEILVTFAALFVGAWAVYRLRRMPDDIYRGRK